jgi:hypothetical protein
MTRASAVRKTDRLRAAEVARKTGCRVEIKSGDFVITVIPEVNSQKDAGIDYSPPEL